MSYTREQLIEAAWRKCAAGQGRGSLKFLLRKHQWPIYESVWDCLSDDDPEHTSHVINSSRQFGKSFTELVIAVEVCLGKPKATVVFAAPYKEQAEEILTGKTYHTIFDTCPSDLKPKLDGSKAVDFQNGSRIRLGGVDNKQYNYLRGGAADLLILDEAGFMSHLDDGVLPALQPMLVTTKGKTIFSSTPPPNLDHPYVNIVREHAERGHVSTFTIFDNTSIDASGLIREYTNTGCKKDIDGNWILSTRFKREFLAELVTENTILIARDWDDRFIGTDPEDEYSQYWHKYIAMDPGTVDFTAVLFSHYNYHSRTLFVEDELHLNGPELNTLLLAKLIKEKRDELWTTPVYRHIADNNNLHLLADLNKLYDLPFIGTTKGRLESTKVHQKEGMVNKLNTFLKTERIIIHPRCEMLLGNLRYGTWKTNGETREFAHSKKYGHYDHLAALVYQIRNLDENTNPIPGSHNFNSDSMFRLKTPENTSNNRNLNIFASALTRK